MGNSEGDLILAIEISDVVYGQWPVTICPCNEETSAIAFDRCLQTFKEVFKIVGRPGRTRTSNQRFVFYDSFQQAGFIHRLKYVIDAVDIESSDSIFIVSGSEDNNRRRTCL